MYIAKEEIAEKLKKMQSVARDGTNPGKQGVLVKEGALFAYGGNMSMRAKLSVKSGQTFVLPPKAIGLIESLPEGMLTITRSEKQVRIETSGIKNVFQTFPPEEYPQEEHAECGEEIVLPMERLQGALRCAASCAMRDQVKPLYSGGLFEAKDGCLNLIATDAVVLCWEKIAYTGRDFAFNLPRKTVEKLLEIGKEEELRIMPLETKAVFSIGDYVVSSSLLAGAESYVRYDSIINDCEKIEIPTASLDMAVRRARVFATIKDRSIELRLKGDRITLKLQSELGNYEEEMETAKGKQSAEEMCKWFSIDVLQNMLRAYYHDTLCIGFVNPAAPVMQIQSVDGSLRMAMVACRPPMQQTQEEQAKEQQAA